MASSAILRGERHHLPWVVDCTRRLVQADSCVEQGAGFQFWSGLVRHEENVGRRIGLGMVSLVSGQGKGASSVIRLARCSNDVIWEGIGRSICVRYSASFVAAKDAKEKDSATAPKQVKEASLKECDQAVEGLSSLKAKAKAKQIEKSSAINKSSLQKLWARHLGIGPALRRR